MKVLAVDTATTSCSAAIVDDGLVSAELTTVNNQTHSKHLMNMIDTVCGMSGVKIADISRNNRTRLVYRFENRYQHHQGVGLVAEQTGGRCFQSGCACLAMCPGQVSGMCIIRCAQA